MIVWCCVTIVLLNFVVLCYNHDFQVIHQEQKSETELTARVLEKKNSQIHEITKNTHKKTHTFF